MSEGLSFDVATLLGIGAPDPTPLPEAAEGEIVLRIPEGISPKSLRASPIGQEFIWQDRTWYDRYQWADQSVPAGVYHMRLPVPDSNRKTFEEQKTLLAEGEETALLVLVELALLCLKTAYLPNRVNGGWIRCAETTAAGNRVELLWHDGRLYVNNFYWDGSRYGHVWLASARTS